MAALFGHIQVLIDKAADSVEEHTASARSFKHWCGDADAVDAFERHRQPLGAAIRDIVRKELVDYTLALMAAFDGATAMSDDGTRFTITDQSGAELPSYLHTCLGDYFADQGLR